MPRKRKPYTVKSQEEGRGPVYRKSFTTLAEASQYIRERWQGAEYMDGDDAFHTDYSTYVLVGFTLSDIGKRRSVFDEYEGEQLFAGFEFDFSTEEELLADK